MTVCPDIVFLLTAVFPGRLAKENEDVSKELMTCGVMPGGIAVCVLDIGVPVDIGRGPAALGVEVEVIGERGGVLWSVLSLAVPCAASAAARSIGSLMS